MPHSKTTCGLYIISPEAFIPEEFAAKLQQALSEGLVAVFQLRIKNASDAEIIKVCEALIPICHKHGVQFILNDYVHLANKVGADGVHIGIEDISLSDARAMLGTHKVIGVSCYADAERAIDVAQQGADYVAFGAFYATQTKIARGRPKPEILSWWSQNSNVPCVAIGGIKPHNCAPLVAAGADFIAVVTAIWDAPAGPAAAVKQLSDAICQAL